ncbi:MAG TPA: RHS repeat-associated core domain-containing protein [Candidatus Acidoferrales bacterium]|nr:RHS repeat-associated core domain-containing protein [Candidatus Acidoferrales bacterium]
MYASYSYDGDLLQHYKFTGKERDAESGLDDFGSRHYGSGLGRFMQPDPIFFQTEMLADPQRFNQYAYVRNNPLALVDPKGEAIQLMCTYSGIDGGWPSHSPVEILGVAPPLSRFLRQGGGLNSPQKLIPSAIQRPRLSEVAAFL